MASRTFAVWQGRERVLGIFRSTSRRDDGGKMRGWRERCRSQDEPEDDDETSEKQVTGSDQPQDLSPACKPTSILPTSLKTCRDDSKRRIRKWLLLPHANFKRNVPCFTKPKSPHIAPLMAIFLVCVK